MKIFLSNYHHRPGHCGGGDLHIEAFIREAAALGHELVSLPTCTHPAVRRVRPDALAQWWHLLGADIHYLRIQDDFPRRKLSRWFTPPWRSFAPRSALVWEFNTVPEQGACIGRSAAEIARARDDFRRAAPHCQLAVCVSEAIAGYARAELGVARTLVIPNGATLAAPPPPRESEGLDVIWAGSAYIRWHAFDLLRAAAVLLHRDVSAPPVRFHFYGPGTEKLDGLPPNVTAHGPVSHETVRAACGRMHAALCVYEPGPGDYCSPLKFYDCLGAGLPVVTTPHPQMDIVQNSMGAGSLVVADRSPASLARILVGLARDEPLRRRLAAASQAEIADRYEWSALMRTLFATLETLPRNRRG